LTILRILEIVFMCNFDLSEISETLMGYGGYGWT